MAKKPAEPVARKPGRPKSEPTMTTAVRLTLPEHAFYTEIGGTRAFKKWLRERMEKGGPKMKK